MYYFDKVMNEEDRKKLKEKLLHYPHINPENLDEQVLYYEDREARKKDLIDKGFSNALAEHNLDKQGYLRPPGWHSVFFFPGSYRLRNKYVFFSVLLLLIIYLTVMY